MSNRKPSSEELMELLRRQRGSCPDAEQLLAYQDERLAPAERTAVEQHVAACGVCLVSLARLRHFDEATLEDTVDVPGWQEIEYGLRERVWEMASVRKRVPGPFDRAAAVLRQFFWRPAVAYFLALLLLYPAYLGLFTGDQTAVGNASVLVLSSPDLRSAERGAPDGIRLSPEDSFLVLQFFVPIREAPGISYAASIVGPSGSVIEIGDLQSTDNLGNFSLVCPESLLSPGAYKLVVREQDAAKKEPVETFQFPFDVLGG
jgi:hypothetical protein